MCKFLFYFGVFVSVLVFQETMAQVSLPDSLKQKYASAKKDSTYIDLLNEVASSYLKKDPGQARQIATYTADLSPHLKYVKGYARALTIIGNSYWYEGVFEFAQNYYLLAARQYQNIGDSIGLGQVYNNIGEINKRFEEYETALNYFLKSIQLRKNDTTLALTLYNIGELYIDKGELEEASKYIYESLDLAKQRNDERSITYCYWSIARIKMAEGNFNEALPFYQLAVERWLKLGENRILIQTYLDMAKAYHNKNQTIEAQKYLDKAWVLGKTINVPDLKIQTYRGYSQLYEARGDYAKALYYFSLHNALKDSVYNLLKSEQMARVQIIYETERQQHENEQLRTEKELRDQQLKSKEGLITAISSGLFLVVVLAIVLFQQHAKILKANKLLKEKNEKISFQKEAIEVQAATMLKLNDELKNLNKTLELRIEERSKQLVLQNQKLAQYSFVNAHKLRAPVASIIGLIQLLNQPLEPEEKEIIIGHLKTCSLQLDHVIHEISRNLAADA